MFDEPSKFENRNRNEKNPFDLMCFSGTMGEATVEVQLQDDGGTDNNGVDTSAVRIVTIKVYDYIFAEDFDPQVCQPD